MSPHGKPSATPGSVHGTRDSLKCANKNTKTWQESGITLGFLPAVTAAGGLPGLGCTLQKGEDTWKRAHRGTD